MSAFTFTFWLLVGDFRNGASPWIPFIALASLEVGLFVSGLTGRNNGLLDSRVSGAGIEDFDLMTPVAQRMLLERARELWVAPREIVDRVGLLDERFEGAFFEDNDYLERLRQADIPTRQDAGKRPAGSRAGGRHVGGPPGGVVTT